MRKIAVITGAGAGVGRAVVREFARRGCDVALLSRDAGRLAHAAEEARRAGVRALPISTDVADADAVDKAAGLVEQELGPIDMWVNVAMATVFAPVHMLTSAEVRRATEVTYLGQVHGILAALRYMRPRGRGTIVAVGSALAHRAVPLQSVYCGAKFAIRGFVNSLRSELMHEHSRIHVAEVDLPAVNTPQFQWARNKTGVVAQPVPPVFQPEVVARVIVSAAFHPRRQVWVGWPAVKAILANRIVPGLLDRYLARAGYTGQLTGKPREPEAPDNLFAPVPGDFAAHGRFDAVALDGDWQIFADRHRGALGLAAAGVLLCGAAWWGGRGNPTRGRTKRADAAPIGTFGARKQFCGQLETTENGGLGDGQDTSHRHGGRSGGNAEPAGPGADADDADCTTARAAGGHEPSSRHDGAGRHGDHSCR